jgi:hypothetical protein
MTSAAMTRAQRPRRGVVDKLRRLCRDNGLSLVLFGLFTAFAIGQIMTGVHAYNHELAEHGRAAVSLGQYLGTGHFIEAFFENWESEFLQMGAFVLLTVKLRQRGSSESKPIEQPADQDEDPRKHRRRRDAPWPVRRGGLWLALYEHSLSIALFLLFAVSFVLHALGGLRHLNSENLLHGKPAESLAGYVSSAQFWFESFQNWQSEFLAVFAIIVLSIFLRQRGSSQSKPVAAPHAETEA